MNITSKIAKLGARTLAGAATIAVVGIYSTAVFVATLVVIYDDIKGPNRHNGEWVRPKKDHKPCS